MQMVGASWLVHVMCNGFCCPDVTDVVVTRVINVSGIYTGIRRSRIFPVRRVILVL
jgi:hypothetical protein